MLESQQSRSNLDQDWVRSISILLAGMLESQHLRLNLDQDWLRGMRIVSEGMLDLSCLGQIWIKTSWEVLAYYQQVC